MKLGAYDYLTKPFRLEELSPIIEKAFEKKKLRSENLILKTRIERQQDNGYIVAKSPAMLELLATAGKIASSDYPVLITGESGAGKELIASSIHAGSKRPDKPFIALNCGAIPENMIESELFGYEKGAFTGANARKEGRFELANGGTLFLDEIGEVAPSVQVKLLRVLQDGKFERLGGTRTIDADVRIIAATNKDLHKEVEEKRFREDLFYRLNVITIQVPSLRERKGDVQLLAMHFLKLYADKNNKPIEGFSEEAMLALSSYDWPGNVRELENAIERAVVFTNGKLIPLSVLPQSVSAFAESRHSLTFKIGTPLRELERKAIDITLQHTRGDKNMAARLLGIATRTIYRHLEKVENGEDEASLVESDTTTTIEGDTVKVQ
jgi:two-component system response regulator HydG